MNLIADTHTHSTASTHAYSTIQENIRAAAQKGLYALAVTDHGAAMPGAPGKWYFENLRVLPRRMDGVLILRGEETNVLGCSGETDLIPKDLETLDWVIASIHKPVFQEKAPSVEQITDVWLRIAENPHINVIGHSGTTEYVYDYEKVLPVFARNGKLVELNESTFHSRSSSVPNCAKIMALCKKLNVPIIVNSDSHFFTQIGCFPNSQKLLEELDFPEELVVNSSVERFQAYLKQYTRVLSGE